MDVLKRLLENPAQIFEVSKSPSTAEQLNGVTTSLLNPLAKEYSVLEEIYTDGLDSTQVWGQAQMVLLGVAENLLYEKLPQLKKDNEVASDNDNDDDEEDDDEDEAEAGEHDSDAEEGTPVVSDEEGSVGSAESDEEEQADVLDAESEKTKVASDEEVETEKKDHVKDVFGLNDGFFDIDQFNKQLEELEDEPEQDDEEQIDLYADFSDNENSSEDEMEYYNEFFDAPGTQKTAKKSTRKNEEDDDDDFGRELEDEEYENAVGSAMLDLFAEDDNAGQAEETSTEKLSSFEKQQQSIQAEIAKLEAELVTEKKWTMKGEVRSGDRPLDSLLDDEEAPSLEFDRTAKPVPVITDEVTETIEDLIKRRIKSDEFNDLPKRLITDVKRFVQKQKTDVSDQKSSKSLAEIYEDEFHGVDPEAKISEEVEAAHNTISDLFAQLNHKLDSLCLAHYIPKPSEFKSIEVKVTDAPASIATEDAQPLHISDETKLAPQEVYRVGDDKPKADGARGVSQVQLKSGLSYSKDELSRDDKQRLHRAKKRAKSKHFNELKEQREARDKQLNASKPQGEQDHKRRRVGEVVDTLSRAKNVTVIDKKGQLRDAKGNLKKDTVASGSSGFRL